MDNVQVDLDQLKKLQIEILKEFLSVCEKLNLRYYLLGGTLLGAVRHKGFIPWDDDIDVGMPRADYDVFMQKAQALLPKKMFVQSVDSEPEYLMCFGKIRNSETTFIESSISCRKINHGVYIDIFPLDYFPDDPKEQKRINTKKRLYDRRLLSEFLPLRKQPFFGVVKSLALFVRFPSAKKVIRQREQCYKSVGESDMIANYGGAWGQKEIVPKEWYAEGAELTFEGIPVRGPKEYDKWLTQVYGNYMELPPVEKRVGHHYTDVIDLEQPYTVYCK